MEEGSERQAEAKTDTEGTKRWPLRIDTAPGKEWLPAITQGNVNALESFYAARLEWCGGYPLVHDRLVTYGAFPDIPPLTPEARTGLLPTAFIIARDADDELFHAALFLLGCLLPASETIEGPAHLADIMAILRQRVDLLNFLPNLDCAWDAVLNKSCFLAPRSGESWDKIDIEHLKDKDVPCEPVNVEITAQDDFRDCPVAFAEIARMAQHTAVVGVKLCYRGKAVCRSSTYWVWQCNVRQKNWVWVPYIYVRRDINSEIEFGTFLSHCHPMEDKWLAREIRANEFMPRQLSSVRARIAENMAGLKAKVPRRRKKPMPPFQWPKVAWQMTGERRKAALIDNPEKRFYDWLAELPLPEDSKDRIAELLVRFILPVLQSGFTVAEYTRDGISSPFQRYRTGSNRMVRVQLQDLTSLWADHQDIDIYRAGEEPIFYLPSRTAFRLFDILDDFILYDGLWRELWLQLEDNGFSGAIPLLKDQMSSLLTISGVTNKMFVAMGIPEEIILFTDRLRSRLALTDEPPIDLMSYDFETIWRLWDNYKKIAGETPALLRTFHLAVQQPNLHFNGKKPDILDDIHERFREQGISEKAWQAWVAEGETFLQNNKWDAPTMSGILGLLNIGDLYSEPRMPEILFLEKIDQLQKRIPGFYGMRHELFDFAANSWFQMPLKIMILLVRRAEILEKCEPDYGLFIDRDVPRIFAWANAHYDSIQNDRREFTWDKAMEEALQWRDIIHGFNRGMPAMPKRMAIDGFRFKRIFDSAKAQREGYWTNTFLFNINNALGRRDRAFYEIKNPGSGFTIAHVEYIFEPATLCWKLGRIEGPSIKTDDANVLAAARKAIEMRQKW